MKLPFQKRTTTEKHKPTPEEKMLRRQEARAQRMIRRDAVMAVLIDSFTSLMNNLPTQSAAAIAYYFLFSIFPLTIFIVMSLSLFADINVIQSQLVNFLQGVLPGSETLVTENLLNLISYRKTSSLFATVSLLWSGSGMFNGIISNIQKAWPESRQRGYFINRAFAIFLIIILLVVIVGLMTFSVVFSLTESLAFFNLAPTETIQIWINLFTSYILPVVTLYLLGFLLYYSIPTAEVSRKAARISALIFAVVWRLFTRIFAAYIISPMNRYNLLYGSITTVIVVLLYIYFSSFIVLYPAHLCAAITHYFQRKAHQKQTRKPAVATRHASRTRNYAGKTIESGNVRPFLNDPIVLAPTPKEKTRKKDVWVTVWTFIKGLFRWK